MIAPMRAVVSRVTSASVTVDGTVVGEIDGQGLLALVGVTNSDTAAVAVQLARKLLGLRILRDEQSCESTGAPLLVVSQFTLYGQTTKGRRPTWVDAAPRAIAEPLIQALIDELRASGAQVETGSFGAEMAVTSVNDGPFTVLLEIPAPGLSSTA
jgi:D-aminoacyl-tRNA deacylase